MKKFSAFVMFFVSASLASVSAFSDYYYYYPERTYEVTVTNITLGETFTPILSAAHKKSIRFFELGAPASAPLAELAEGGAVGPLQEVLEGSDLVSGVAVSPGLLEPGNSVTFTIKSSDLYARLSLASMLIPTNDTFVALDAVKFPKYGTLTYLANAYDAGSEPNDELCVNMPGPACGGEGSSPDAGGEGYVFSSPGIHGEGDLLVSEYGFSGAVAKVTVTRVYK